MSTPWRRARGLTLIELMTVIAISAVLVSLAVPSFGAQIARTHLKAAAERLAGDLAEARFESTRRGLPLHLHFETGGDWCYSVAVASDCPCNSAQTCQIRRVDGREHKGVTLEQAGDLHFDPANGSADTLGAATLRNARGDALRVELTRLGRAKICAPDSTSLGYPVC